MSRYDPDRAPNPEEWLDTDEQERIDAVLRYHRKTKVRIPHEKMHATIHAVVESQLAVGFPASVRALERLMKEGLSRHDAIHAIGCAVADLMHGAMSGQITSDAPEHLTRALDKLTKAEWHRQYGGDD